MEYLRKTVFSYRQALSQGRRIYLWVNLIRLGSGLLSILTAISKFSPFDNSLTVSKPVKLVTNLAVLDKSTSTPNFER